MKGEGIVNSGRFLFGQLKHPVYKILGHLPSGLQIDVGAAACMYSRLMLTESPGSRVVAFEPFPGNWQFAEKAIARHPAIKLRKEAVSDTNGVVKFHVASTVPKGAEGWEHLPGYSSVGHIVTEQGHQENTIEVQCVRLDSLITERVRLCKIDVQGGELAVLLGADILIQNYGVDIFLIEFSGELEILEYLSDRDYVFFDTEYLLFLTRRDAAPRSWQVMRTANLSTGDKAVYAWPLEAPRSLKHYCNWFRRQGRNVGGLQTDLVAVHRRALPDFVAAAASAMSNA